METVWSYLWDPMTLVRLVYGVFVVWLLLNLANWLLESTVTAQVEAILDFFVKKIAAFKNDISKAQRAQGEGFDVAKYQEWLESELVRTQTSTNGGGVLTFFIQNPKKMKNKKTLKKNCHISII